MFLGIGPAGAVDEYLAGVQREVGAAAGRPADFRLHEGGRPRSAPAAQSFWAASVVGSGARELTWKPETGRWRIVLMNADGSAGVRAELSAGARFPHLLAIGIGALATGLFFAVASSGILFASVRRRT